MSTSVSANIKNRIRDSNVFVSGIFFSGPPSEILKAWGDTRLQIVFSLSILDEYQRVAEYLAEQYPSIDILPIMDMIMMYGELIVVENESMQICDDPDDEKFFECEMVGKCPIIISGDKHLLRLSGHEGITVLKPREFVDAFLKKRL